MRTFEKGIQKKVLSLLAIEDKEGNDPVSIQYIKQYFGITSTQMKQVRKKLLEKRLIAAPIREHLSFVRIPRDYRYRICSHLTSKNGRSYCPIKKTIIGEKDITYFCGILQCVRFDDCGPEIYYAPTCPGWTGGICSYRPRKQCECPICGSVIQFYEGLCEECRLKRTEVEELPL